MDLIQVEGIFVVFNLQFWQHFFFRFGVKIIETILSKNGRNLTRIDKSTSWPVFSVARSTAVDMTRLFLSTRPRWGQWLPSPPLSMCWRPLGLMYLLVAHPWVLHSGTNRLVWNPFWHLNELQFAFDAARGLLTQAFAPKHHQLQRVCKISLKLHKTVQCPAKHFFLTVFYNWFSEAHTRW